MRRACIVRVLGAAALLTLWLHGAVVRTPERRSLEYAVGNARASVSYARNGDGSYTFQFVDTEGKVSTRTFRPEAK